MEYNSIGHSLSIISLKIKQNGADAHIPDRYIGRVKIPLGTLLKICAGEEGISPKYNSINEI